MYESNVLTSVNIYRLAYMIYDPYQNQKTSNSLNTINDTLLKKYFTNGEMALQYIIRYKEKEIITGKTKVEVWCRKMKKQTNEYKQGIISSFS